VRKEEGNKMREVTVAVKEPTVAEIKEYEMRHKRILQCKREVGKNFWQIGLDLKEIKEKRLYTVDGHPNFNSYLGSPEVSFRRTVAYALIAIITYLGPFVSDRSDIDITSIDYSKLEKILPVVRAYPEETEEWVEKARALSRSDLIEEVKARLGIEEITYPYQEEIKVLRNIIWSLANAFKGEDMKMAVLDLHRLIDYAQDLLTRIKQGEKDEVR